MKDFRFSYKFKMACKEDVLKLCPNIKKKVDVVICLSTTVRNDTLQEAKEHRVSLKCRKQLRVEELEMVMPRAAAPSPRNHRGWGQKVGGGARAFSAACTWKSRVRQAVGVRCSPSISSVPRVKGFSLFTPLSSPRPYHKAACSNWATGSKIRLQENKNKRTSPSMRKRSFLPFDRVSVRSIPTPCHALMSQGSDTGCS